MLISNFFMLVASQQFPRVRMAVHPMLGDNDPALVRIAVQLRADSSDETSTNLAIPDVTASLSICDHGPSPPHSAEVLDMFFEDVSVPITCSYDAPAEYFNYKFRMDSFYHIRVDFVIEDSQSPATITDNTNNINGDSDPPPKIMASGNPRRSQIVSTEPNRVFMITDGVSVPLYRAALDQHIGSVVTTLRDICDGIAPTIEPPIEITPLSRKIINSVSLLRKWGRPGPDHKLVFQMSVKITRKGGWPFTSRRPFFVLFRWDAVVSRWDAFYRSEVLTAPSESPEAKGAMVFRLVILKLRDVIDNDPNMGLRIEFFHYKIGEPQLLAYYHTTFSELFHTRPGALLPLTLNVFPRSELVGNMELLNNQVMATRYYYSLQAKFGGLVQGNFVYIVLTVTDPTYKPGRVIPRNSRAFFMISWCKDDRCWVEVYKSEPFPRFMPRESTYTFRTVRLTEQRLDVPNNPLLCIKICRGSPNGTFESIAAGYTKISKLLQAKGGSILKLNPPVDQTQIHPAAPTSEACGYIRLDHREKFDSKMLFKLGVVLNSKPPDSDIR